MQFVLFLVLLLSYIWDCFLNVKSETVFIYILMSYIHVVITFRGVDMSGAISWCPSLYNTLPGMLIYIQCYNLCALI